MYDISEFSENRGDSGHCLGLALFNPFCYMKLPSFKALEVGFYELLEWFSFKSLSSETVTTGTAGDLAGEMTIYACLGIHTLTFFLITHTRFPFFTF